MHITEGVLAAPVLGAGAALTAAGCAIGLKKMDFEQTPKTAVVASVFFVASLIHVPIGPVSAHLMLNGLAGVILGWTAFPALLVALFLQAVLFQFGGLTALGVNTFNMAMPAVFCSILFSSAIRGKNNLVAMISGFATGLIAILGSGILVALSLVFTGAQFLTAAKIVIIAHIPIMIIEGLIIAFVVGFLRRTRPEILGRRS